MTESRQRRSVGRSFLALLAGFVLVVVLSILTDVILHITGVYGIAGSYVTARLAPYAPMGHALTGGAIGLVLALVGAVATWGHPEKFGAHWYPVALVILALPTAWVGGKIRVRQLE